MQYLCHLIQPFSAMGPRPKGGLRTPCTGLQKTSGSGPQEAPERNAASHRLVTVMHYSVVERETKKVKMIIMPSPPQRRSTALTLFKFGFVNGGSEAEPRAQCVECGVTLAKEALKPSKLRWHLERKHPNLVGKPVDGFKRKENGLQMQKKNLSCH